MFITFGDWLSMVAPETLLGLLGIASIIEMLLILKLNKDNAISGTIFLYIFLFLKY